ncbi:polysaccharide biosynthesis/export family protein [Frigidibacter mobilis]|uniref:Polysaccharide biosynthesis/export family protein n=1 Tax=Frigidibacter mobilis TaxID=1335048 RepID=A0A159Z2Y2_9RHOB|nr:polysaccharide biosynthesis/export family protein [Frigidibacter mobilis]AMY69375.1 polysaccharide biosynthesis/export family protein [Frigidibacter mobilis]
MRFLTSLSVVALLAGCGVAYQTPSVREGVSRDGKVQVVAITPETVLAANRSSFEPKSLPAVFSTTAGSGGALRNAGEVPDTAFLPVGRPDVLETRVPPPVQDGPYTIGVGDVVLLATPQAGNTIEELSGLLAAQNSRQGYTVQDDGAIAVPDVGRIPLAGLTLEEAEAVVFRRLVESQIDPSFSLEVAEFNSKRVSIGGAVKTPTIAPISLTPLRLDQAIVAAGGITVADQDYATIRIYRDGTIYQIPLAEFYTRPELQKVRLTDGDSVFVDTEYDLAKAESYFSEQIQLATFRANARELAIAELQTEVSLRRADMAEARTNFGTRLDLDSVDRDYVYLTGEVTKQGRYPLPFDRKAVLADAIYGQGGGMPNEKANARNIYVLRGSADPREFGAVTAWQLDARNAANLLLATRFELRPNDVVFISEQPVTRWSRVINQITPSIINLTASVAD